MPSSVSRFFDQHVREFTQALKAFEQRLSSDATPDNDQAVDDLTACINASLAECSQLEAELKETDPDGLKPIQQRYREAIWPWFGQSWFMDRALSKPRGYPGDYAMLSAIYDCRPRSAGFGGYMDRYFLNTTLGHAVKDRMHAVGQFLQAEIDRRQGRARLLNVACGPCREYVDAITCGPGWQVQLTCVDNDTEAMEFVEREVAPRVAPGVAMNFVRYNALRMTSAKKNIEVFGRPDLIYSVGLCDYIPDNYLIPMLRGWRETVADDGVVYVAFKDTRLYDKAEYQWLVDWFFLERTEAECQRLFAEAGYDLDTMSATRCGPGGVIINFVQQMPAGGFARIDPADALPKAQHSETVAEVAKKVTS